MIHVVKPISLHADMSSLFTRIKVKESIRVLHGFGGPEPRWWIIDG